MDNKIFLNRYRLSLGRNGLPVVLHRAAAGTTYRAQEMVSGREVAIELMPAPSADPAALEALHDEAAAAGQINHLNIPILHDFGVEDDQLIYVTEYFDGPTAQAWVAARGPLGIGSVLRLAVQVTAALGAASFHRLAPRALNPANIVLMPGQTAKGDWPAIKLLHWLGPKEPPVACEPNEAELDPAAFYLSPEQARGEKVDFASSIYSLGCTMWFLLTGVPPTPAGLGKIGARPGGEKLRGLPKIVRHLLDRMMRFDPAERPQDPVALEAYLQTCLARVERREKIEQRFGVPLISTPRVAKKKTPLVLPIRGLAIAAVLLALAAAAALVLPGMLRAKSSPAPLAQQHDPASAPASPNDFPMVTHDSIGRMDQPVATAPMVIAHNTTPTIPRHEIEARPAEEQDSASPELPPPSQGPDDLDEDPDQPVATDALPDEPALAGEPKPETLVASPLTTEPIASSEATDPAVSEVTTPPVSENASTPEPASSPTEESVAQATPPPKKATTKTVATAPRAKPSRKAKSVAQRTHRSSQSRRNPQVAHSRSVKRARPIPQMRVGSAKAELVGTTSDGRWILSVSKNGKRVIVPPPPGYEP